MVLFHWLCLKINESSSCDWKGNLPWRDSLKLKSDTPTPVTFAVSRPSMSMTISSKSVHFPPADPVFFWSTNLFTVARLMFPQMTSLMTTGFFTFTPNDSMDLVTSCQASNLSRLVNEAVKRGISKCRLSRINRAKAFFLFNSENSVLQVKNTRVKFRAQNWVTDCLNLFFILRSHVCLRVFVCRLENSLIDLLTSCKSKCC